jgi:Transposase DDE domain
MIEKWTSKYKKFVEIAFQEVKRVLRPYSDKFSKKTYTQHQHAVAILLMKYENKPYRDVVELMKELWTHFKFDKSIPHFTTLQKFFARISAYTWEFLLTKTYQLFHTKHANIGIDSTGFRPNHVSQYYYFRFKEIRRTRRFMKHSISVDTDNQAIIASINALSWHNDNVYFVPLARKSKEIVKLNNVTADMGYDSELNHVTVREELGGTSIIPVRSYSFRNGVHSLKSKYRKMLSRRFPLHKYHQRSKVETVNFVEKRKFGDELRSKLLKMQKREMRVIDIVYNIYRFMKLDLFLVVGFLQGFSAFCLQSLPAEPLDVYLGKYSPEPALPFLHLAGLPLFNPHLDAPDKVPQGN